MEYQTSSQINQCDVSDSRRTSEDISLYTNEKGEGITKYESSANANIPYRISIKQCAKVFQTSVTNGLTGQKAQELLAGYGANSLGDGQNISIAKILAHQIFNAMILVLIISMVIAFAVKDWISGGVIAGVVGINIGVGFIQEYKAEQTMGSLKSLSSPTARVIRNGDDVTIPAQEVVPGDIVYIKVGDTIPADLRLVDTMNLETDEALLTGESLPVTKNHLIVYNDYSKPIPVGDRLNLAYSSSIVSKGRGTGIVISTGLDTEIGQIAKSLRGDDSIIRKIDRLDPERQVKKREYPWHFSGPLKTFS